MHLSDKLPVIVRGGSILDRTHRSAKERDHARSLAMELFTVVQAKASRHTGPVRQEPDGR